MGVGPNAVNLSSFLRDFELLELFHRKPESRFVNIFLESPTVPVWWGHEITLKLMELNVTLFLIHSNIRRIETNITYCN